MEMDNKTWLINEIVTSDMSTNAKAELIMMIRPVVADGQAVKKGDIVQPVNEEATGTFTIIKFFYLGDDPNSRILMAVCYNHLTNDFCLFYHINLADKNKFKIVGHHEGGKMTWADG